MFSTPKNSWMSCPNLTKSLELYSWWWFDIKLAWQSVLKVLKTTQNQRTPWFPHCSKSHNKQCNDASAWVLSWGTCKPTTLSLNSGVSPGFNCCPGPSETYYQLGKTRVLQSTKLAHLQQMCSSYITPERWFEFVKWLDAVINQY